MQNQYSTVCVVGDFYEKICEIWAGFEPAEKKWANYEQGLRAVFSCFQSQKKI